MGRERREKRQGMGEEKESSGSILGLPSRLGLPSGAFTLQLFSARFMTEAENFGLSIGQMSQLTNRQYKFSSFSHESCTKKAQCKRTLKQTVIRLKFILYQIYPLCKSVEIYLT